MGLDANISILRENGEYGEEFEKVMDNNHWFLNQIISFHRESCQIKPDVYNEANFKLSELATTIAFQDNNFSEGVIEITETFIAYLESTFIKVIQDTFLGSPPPSDFSFSMSRNLLLIVRLKSALQNKQRLIYMWCW